MQRLVRRMTRFFVKTDPEETISSLISILRKAGYTVKKNSPGQVLIYTSVSDSCLAEFDYP